MYSYSVCRISLKSYFHFSVMAVVKLRQFETINTLSKRKRRNLLFSERITSSIYERTLYLLYVLGYLIRTLRT